MICIHVNCWQKPTICHWLYRSGILFGVFKNVLFYRPVSFIVMNVSNSYFGTRVIFFKYFAWKKKRTLINVHPYVALVIVPVEPPAWLWQDHTLPTKTVLRDVTANIQSSTFASCEVGVSHAKFRSGVPCTVMAPFVFDSKVCHGQNFLAIWVRFTKQYSCSILVIFGSFSFSNLFLFWWVFPPFYFTVKKCQTGHPKIL